MRLLEGSTVRAGFLTVIQDRLRIRGVDSAGGDGPILLDGAPLGESDGLGFEHR